MANWSITDIYFEGTKENIENLKKDLKKIMKDDDTEINPGIEDIKKIFPHISETEAAELARFYMTVNYYNEDNGSVLIQGEGKWSTPADIFVKLSEKHKVNLTFTDVERGSDFSFLLKAEKGKITEKKEEPYFSEITLNSEFGGEYETFLESASGYLGLEDEQVDKVLKKIGITRNEALLEYAYEINPSDLKINPFKLIDDNVKYQRLWNDYFNERTDEKIMAGMLKELFYDNNPFKDKSIEDLECYFETEPEKFRTVIELGIKYYPEVRKDIISFFSKANIKEYLENKYNALLSKGYNKHTAKNMAQNSLLNIMLVVPKDIALPDVSKENKIEIK